MTLDPNRIFNGRDRAATVEMFGYALYEGSVTDGAFNGRHVGVVGTPEAAEAWVAGENPAEIIKVYR